MVSDTLIIKEGIYQLVTIRFLKPIKNTLKHRKVPSKIASFWKIEILK